MFAIIQTGGKQYKVTKDTVVFIEKLPQPIGNDVTFTDVLMMDTGTGVQVGSPLVAGATVLAHIQDQMRTKKILVFKKKRRHQYRRKKGHRQHQTVLRILDITLNNKSIFPEGVSSKPTPRKVEKPAVDSLKAERSASKTAAPKTSDKKEEAASKPAAEKTVKAKASTKKTPASSESNK